MQGAAMFPGSTLGSGLKGVPYPPHGPSSTLRPQPGSIDAQLAYGIQSRAPARSAMVLSHAARPDWR